MSDEQFLQRALGVITEGFFTDDPTGSMRASDVGVILRAGMGESAAYNAGYRKLKCLLTALSVRGAIRIGINSKDAFAIWLTDTNGQGDVQPARVEIESGSPLRSTRWLQKPVWNAFVVTHPDGLRVLNRTTGEIRLAQTCVPAPPDEWVLIDRIDPQAEKEAARQFLASKNIELSEGIRQALESDRWFIKLPEVLTAPLSLLWKRARTAHVIKMVGEWRQHHKVGEQFVYGTATANIRGGGREATGLRQPLLAAIRRMGTEELLTLAIPARHLVAELRPDLL